LIVVTGGTGHLGQWVIQELTHRGFDVACLARTPFGAPTIEGLTWARPVEPIRCDLSEPAAVEAAKPTLVHATAVIHLAAFVPAETARNNDQDAEATLRANVGATISLFAALEGSTRLRAFVNASTFEVYGRPQMIPLDENHPTEPLTYYGASKLCSEGYVRLAAKSQRYAGVSLRFPAIYGPGDMVNRAIGNFARAAAFGEILHVYGGGADLRDLVYAGDAAEAVAIAVESGATGVFNVANGFGHSMRELAETAVAVAGLDSRIEHHERVKPGADYVLDVSAVERELGWAARTPLADGLKAHIAWVRATAPPE
jgi:UDP-glucose 4-epimerase